MFSADVTLYTDNSALTGIKDDRYGNIVITGDPEDLNTIDEFDGVGRKFTSSYTGEKSVLHHALLWMAYHNDELS